MPGQQATGGKPYLRIVGGNIVQTVDKTTDKARLREYELSDGTQGSKWELVFMNWEGLIHNIEFKESKYGDMCNIEFSDAILSLNTSSKYFQDLAQRLPFADITKPILFHPYDIEDGDKRNTGVSVQQNGEKFKNFYWDGKEKSHGFPEVDASQIEKKGYWKMYFGEVEEFLIGEIKKMEFSKPEQTPEEIFQDDDEPDFLKDM